MCYPSECGRSRSNSRSVIKWIHWNFDFSLAAFQGHSRSLEPIQIDPPPVTSYSRSIATMGLYCFRDKRRYQSKIANFPTPVYFAPPWNRVPALGSKKLVLRGRERSLRISSPVWIQYINVMDRATNGQTDGGWTDWQTDMS